MTADAALRSRHQPNQVIGDITGFDAGDAKSTSRLADSVDISGFGEQAFEQRIEAFAAVFALLAPGTQVDAGEHDLANAFARKSDALGDDSPGRAA